MSTFTTKQFGDACEMWVAGYMTLAGIPTTVMPDNWPDYELIAQHPGKQTPLRISVKARGQSLRERARHTYHFRPDGWDWIAFVFVEGCRPRIWILPANVACEASRSDGEHRRLLRLEGLQKQLGKWEGNFCLLLDPPQSDLIAPRG
jgi:hypothetical protein